MDSQFKYINKREYLERIIPLTRGEIASLEAIEKPRPPIVEKSLLRGRKELAAYVEELYRITAEINETK